MEISRSITKLIPAYCAKDEGMQPPQSALISFSCHNRRFFLQKACIKKNIWKKPKIKIVETFRVGWKDNPRLLCKTSRYEYPPGAYLSTFIYVTIAVIHPILRDTSGKEIHM
jgi:hypothetical protein